MSVSKINANLPITVKINNLSDQILEIFGLVQQAKFDIHEITAIYEELGSGYSRQFLRDQSLGHTLATYGGWTYLVPAESGYSIWTYSPTNYQYNSVNQLYIDNKILENRGEANSETATTFDKVFSLIKIPGTLGWSMIGLTVFVRLLLHPFFKQQLVLFFED